ncbi:pseudouridine synthase [Shewanella surugensis]|uniref:Pseudouridine synthase n=1 Tax=Shewanella surugensis TaxID=212020 RepID=A0ABT0LEN2_9GAMM|nr:pseudouridine synthase [Shewanella surugensis]MCL1126164.1 pseudouridine synthase [Shewanella surugensis]
MRLDKFVCKSTELSRMQARASIAAGDVSVNGEIVQDESKQVHENNHVVLNEQTLIARPFRYLMLHKPINTLSSNVDGDHPSIFNHIDIDNPEELHIVGRLDADTTGLVLITDDGRWSFDIIRPKKQCQKTYRVSLRDPINDSVIDRFLQGLQLQGEASLTLPAFLSPMNEREVLLTITEGRYHQVKRMFATVGNRVQSLHRQQVGEVRLDVPLGEWRYLTIDEIVSFRPSNKG